MEENWKFAEEGEAGVCPVCGYELEYDGTYFRNTYINVKDCDDGVCYQWHCPNCGAEGEEVYAIEFSHHNYKAKE